MIKILQFLNESFTFFLIFPAILLLGIYLTIKLRFVQFSRLRQSFKKIFEKRKQETGITHYQAIAAVLAGNFGTGNISGMAIALTTGGPGALVWMWIIAFLGAAIQYSSCILGVKYREKNGQGEFVGGPMYYLSKGVGKPAWGAIFAIFAVLGGLTVGNFAQVNSITLPLSSIGIPPLVSGLVIALLVGLVLLGGMRRFAKIAASIVPIMALFYFGAALIILMQHLPLIIPAFKLMFISAVNPASVAGGALGWGIMKTVATGFDRGIFATDAGTGLAPILQASTESEDSVDNGIATLIAPVLVMIVCTTTGLVLLVTGAWKCGLKSTNMVTAAFSQGLGNNVGGPIVVIALLLFAYTTILAWANCGERAVGYLLGDSWTKRFRWFFIAMVPLGALFDVESVWLLADISISLMLATNMLGVALLSKEVISDTKSAFSKN